MNKIELAINRYKNGEISLFEASKMTRTYPTEFFQLLIDYNRGT